MVLPTFELTGGNNITLTASVLDTLVIPLVQSSVPLSVLVSVTCVKWTKVVRFKMAVCRVNMHYSTRKTVELVLNEGSDLEDFSDSGYEENIVVVFCNFFLFSFLLLRKTSVSIHIITLYISMIRAEENYKR